MLNILNIALGGALGAVMRYLVSTGVHSILGRGFPYGTLTVNVMGSFAMGFLFVYLMERSSLGPEWRALILIGFLGAFTTFSTFSIETLNLLQSGAIVRALANILISVITCILATWLGVILGRQL
ncbi:MAG: fluoride efflux transporter CrcB [Gammaproteobacteria bacterium]|nr:fluoride efflux transporter CrcB [Gammaproteobacteria bacterium]